MVNEILAGLDTFMFKQNHLANLFFRVETTTPRAVRATGGVSVGFTGPSLKNETDPLIMSSNDDINLKCTWGDDLPQEAIKEALDLAHDKLRVAMYSPGRNAEMPGATGEWSSEPGHVAMFKIVGVAPAHITWGNMQDAVHAFADLSFNGLAGTGLYGVAGKEATCEVRDGVQEIATLSITRA
ncbi:MAG: hypothetical protein Q9226_007909 [Calogaya cf. arnoldii]